jgi:DNA-binding NtrC family response regulator
VAPQRILVVDDDAQLRLLLVDTLRAIGYEAIGVTDGIEALDLLQRETVDIVISDIAMPRMDGLELAAQLRRQRPGLGILLITGVGTDETKRRAYSEHLCDGYLTKPFRIDKIETMIEDIVRSHAPQQDGGGPRRILVVDDDPHFLDALVDTVSALGYKVEGTGDSDSALAALKREPASLVLADVSMPEMNGFDLLKLLKRHYPGMPVVIMTGHNLTEPAAAMIRERADAYLTKPFRQEAVRDVISQFDKPEAS